MSHSDQSAEIRTRLSGDVTRELARRSLPGALVYPAMVLVMCFTTPYYHDHSGIIILAGALSLVFGLLRFFSGLRLVETEGDPPPGPKRILISSSVLSALLWGLFAVITFHYYGTEWTSMFVILTAGALAAGASGSLAPNLRLASLCLCLMILPTTFYAIADFHDERSLGLAIGCATYLAFLLVQARENWRAFWAVSLAAERDRLSGSAQLREREAQTRALLEAVPDLILSLDAEGAILDYKPAIGKTPNSLPGFTPGAKIDDVLPAEVCRTMRHHIVDALHTNELQAFRYTVATPGEPVSRHFYARMSVIAGRRVLAVIQEITEQVHLEADLRHAQKLESAGRMAGGIAHDFNNLLTVINGNSELALELVEPAEPVARPLSEIVQAGQRAAQLTRQLLTFSRKELTEFKVLNPNHPIGECLAIADRLVGDKVQLVTSLDPALGNVRGDSGQIHQIVMNLVVNAGNAMPKGGTVVVSTANLHVPDAAVSTPPEVPPGPYVLLRVRDTGVGIDSSIRERIFEPFFTTRQAGKGLGLGLATVHGIVKQHGGAIWVESEPGVGTVFSVLLPRTTTPGEMTEAPPAEHPENAGETVLVVEDDDQVRQLAVSILKHCGYSVLQASLGSEALVIAKSHEGKIDLLLTDAIMPYMNGRDLAEHLKAMLPGLRILFMSGYSEDVITQSDMAGGINFLPKPFTSAALRQKVAAVLAQPVA